MAPIAALCFVAFGTHASNSSVSKGDKPEPPTKKTESSASSWLSVRAVPPIALTPDDEKAFWLTIRPQGIEPSEITVPAGNYFVIIQNATGLNQFAFRVDGENGERLLDVRLPLRKRYWKNTIHLVSGRFSLSEADHTQWNCRITVTAP